MKKGFTLIELLVVVLIIGILAAVALPQYQKAVHKAQGTEALAAADALSKAMEVYFLEHRSYAGADDPEKLSIQMPKLKHFRYSQVGCAPNTTSAEFRGVQVSQSDKRADIYLPIKSSSNQQSDWAPWLWIIWQNGKRTAFNCSPQQKCKEYFNCTLSGDYYCVFQ